MYPEVEIIFPDCHCQCHGKLNFALALRELASWQSDSWCCCLVCLPSGPHGAAKPITMLTIYLPKNVFAKNLKPGRPPSSPSPPPPSSSPCSYFPPGRSRYWTMSTAAIIVELFALLFTAYDPYNVPSQSKNGMTTRGNQQNPWLLHFYIHLKKSFLYFLPDARNSKESGRANFN